MLSLHGGPEAQERPTFSPQHQAMVAAGITVFAPNIRGSSGFGRAFVHVDDVHGRRDAFDDVLACRDFLVELGIADPDRIAVTGRSYGGYLTLATLAFSPGRVRRRRGHLRHVGPAHLLPRHRAVDRGRGVQQVRPPRGGLRAARGHLAAAAVRRTSTCRCWSCTASWTPTSRSARPSRSSPRCVSWAGRWSTCELDGEGHEYRRAESRLRLITRIVDFLTEHL